MRLLHSRGRRGLIFCALRPKLLHPPDGLLVPGGHCPLSYDRLLSRSDFPDDVTAIDDVERFQRDRTEPMVVAACALPGSSSFHATAMASPAGQRSRSDVRHTVEPMIASRWSVGCSRCAPSIEADSTKSPCSVSTVASALTRNVPVISSSPDSRLKLRLRSGCGQTARDVGSGSRPMCSSGVPQGIAVGSLEAPERLAPCRSAGHWFPEHSRGRWRQ